MQQASVLNFLENILFVLYCTAIADWLNEVQLEYGFTSFHLDKTVHLYWVARYTALVLHETTLKQYCTYCSNVLYFIAFFSATIQ